MPITRGTARLRQRAATLLKPRLTLLCLSAIAASALGFGVRAQADQREWWDDFPGFQNPGYGEGATPQPSPKSEEGKKAADALRPGSTPLRSQEMLDALDDAIDGYTRIANKGGWPEIPQGKLIRAGDGDERIPKLRRRLSMTGDLKRRGDDYSGFESYDYDEAMEAAVKRFQTRHGLRISGRVDKATVEALNAPVEARLAQLNLNRNRIADLVRQPPEERYVLVNIPAYQLEGVELGEARLRHRVIVGRSGRETPELKATIRNVNFFPYWRVPDSVAQLDLIPRVRKEPEYLENEKIRVVANDFNGPEMDPAGIDWETANAAKIKFRQEPGPQNALGLVRLDMANEHGVYMHDTPLKKLFDQRQRAFSAGCVRVQNVFELVEWIAGREPGWDQPGRVQETIDQGLEQEVQLTQPVPVYFAYVTAWAEPEGDVQFRPDIYGRDGRQEFAAGLGREDDEAPPPPQTLAP